MTHFASPGVPLDAPGYYDAWRHGLCVCVSAEPRLRTALVLAAKVMRCIQCSVVIIIIIIRLFLLL